MKNTIKRSEKAKLDFCKKNNWTTEQPKDLLEETLQHKCKKFYISEDGEICEYRKWIAHKQKIEKF